MNRKYEIDWLRIILIFSVFIYHVGMIFNEWDWHIKDTDRQMWLSPIMHFLHIWRMPLLFFISGIGTYYASRKRNGTQLFTERTKRLFIPLVAGIFILVPIQVYYEKIAQYASLIDLYKHMFDGVYPSGNFSWHHLWFICYLYFFSILLCITVFNVQKIKLPQSIRNIISTIAGKWATIWLFIIPLTLSELILRPYFPHETHAFIDDWAYMNFNFLIFLFGYIIASGKTINNNIYKYRRINLTIFVISTLLFFYMRNSHEGYNTLYGIIKIVLVWFGIITSIGYAKRFLCFDNRLRGVLNKAIYPFYLLHQPAIVATAYYILQLNTSALNKAILITVTSFIISVLIYIIIKQFNITRVLFGMKPKRTNSRTTVIDTTQKCPAYVLIPKRNNHK